MASTMEEEIKLTNIEENIEVDDNKNTGPNIKHYLCILLFFTLVFIFLYTRPKKCEDTMISKPETKVDTNNDYALLLNQKIQEFSNLQMQSIASL